MKFFTIDSLSSGAVTERKFSSLPTLNYAQFKDKTEFIAWAQRPTTKHAFISTFEGIDPTRRVNNENAPYACRGLIADYDGIEENDSDEALLERVQRRALINPNYFTRTFSGNVRLIWDFEAPVIASPELMRKFIKELCRELSPYRVLTGIDKGALQDLSKYYECGTSRVSLDQPKLSSSMLNHILLEVSARVDWGAMAEEVSMDLVAAAVDERFPGIWTGPFVVGARGPRFWDPTANNPTACIVRESGMQCFTGTQPFVPWGQIFGAAFVREAVENRINRAIENVYFDGTKYWVQHSQGWSDYARIDILTHFRVAGLEAHDCDAALSLIQKNKRVGFAAPLVFYPDGIVPIMGKRVINTSSVKAMKAADKPVEWGERFPSLGDFLAGFFEPIDGEDKQLVHFLAWLRRWYLASVGRKPEPGQVIFIAGEVAQGKTFLSNVVLNRIFGGCADASSFLLGETQFSGHLFNTGLWTIDDTRPSHDAVHAKYSAMLKKIPANQLFLYNEKYAKACMIPWLGRIVVSCNLDAESLRSIPDVEQSLLDKIMILKVATREFFDFKVLVRDLDEELPHFLKWLEEWDPSEEDDSILEASRYGVSSFHHPELLQAAREVTDSYSFLETLAIFVKEHCESTGESKWSGTPTDLLRTMSMDDSMKPLLTGITAKMMGRRLSQLKNQGAPLEKKKTNAARLWVIPKDIMAWQSETDAKHSK